MAKIEIPGAPDTHNQKRIAAGVLGRVVAVQGHSKVGVGNHHRHYGHQAHRLGGSLEKNEAEPQQIDVGANKIQEALEEGEDHAKSRQNHGQEEPIAGLLGAPGPVASEENGVSDALYCTA